MKNKKQSGQVLVIVAFALVALIGMAGIAIDGGRAYADQRSLEAAAEAGAHAGAYLLETNWNGDAGNFGGLTDIQVQTTIKTFAGYNGYNAANGDTFYYDYVAANRTTHSVVFDNTARGVLVQLGKPQIATFTRVLGFQIYSDFARATAMFGAALVAGALPLAIDDGCSGVPPPAYNVNYGFQPANGGGGFGTCNLASIVPPGCVAGDLPCYNLAMAKGMNPPPKLGPAYPVNSFDCCTLSAGTVAALNGRIAQRPAETCTTFVSPSPRVVFMPVVPGGFGGATVTFTRFRAFFLTSVEPSNPSKGFSGCFVKATVNSGDFDPNAVGTAYGAVMIMKLVPSTGVIVPITVTVTSLTPAAVRGMANGATLIINTSRPGATCTVLVFDLPPAPGSPSIAGGLGPRVTDGAGNATWTWTVDNNAILQPTNVRITCSYHAELGYATSTMVII